MTRDPAWAPTQQVDEQGNPIPPKAPKAGSRRRREPQRREPRWLRYALIVVAGLLLGAIAMTWWQRREPAPLAGPSASPSTPSASASGTAGGVRALTTDQLTRTIAQAGEKVKQSPADSAAWAMLAHSQAMLGDFDAARKSYAALAKLLPNDAQVWADYADAAAVAQGRKLAGEPAQLIAKALALDPNHPKALMLAGREAFERKKYGEAIGHWTRALGAVNDPALKQELEANIAEARAFDGRERPSPAQLKRAGGATITGRVSLAPALQAQASPEDAVFIFARPVKGSRMPVALLRKKVKDLPLDFTLDDTQAMVPDIKLSMLGTVAVGARISKRGDATPQPGDLQGLVEPVELGSKGVKVEIREVLK